jgi:hypothetical protein
MLFSALALGLGMALSPQAVAQASTPPSAEGVAVYLGCQVDHAALTDCKVVNDEPVDASVVGQAVKLAEQMSLPSALAAHPGRIVIKLNVKP